MPTTYIFVGICTRQGRLQTASRLKDQKRGFLFSFVCTCMLFSYDQKLEAKNVQASSNFVYYLRIRLVLQSQHTAAKLLGLQ